MSNSTIPFPRVADPRNAGARPPNQQVTEGQAAQLVHDSYLVQLHQHICTNCQCGESYIQLFEVWVHPTLTGQTKYAVKRPTTTIKPGLDVVYLGMPEQEMPVCSECVAHYKVADANLAPVATREAWAETLARKARERTEAVAKQQREKHVPKLEDL